MGFVESKKNIPEKYPLTYSMSWCLKLCVLFISVWLHFTADFTEFSLGASLFLFPCLFGNFLTPKEHVCTSASGETWLRLIRWCGTILVCILPQIVFLLTSAQTTNARKSFGMTGVHKDLFKIRKTPLSPGLFPFASLLLLQQIDKWIKPHLEIRAYQQHHPHPSVYLSSLEMSVLLVLQLHLVALGSHKTVVTNITKTTGGMWYVCRICLLLTSPWLTQTLLKIFIMCSKYSRVRLK